MNLAEYQQALVDNLYNILVADDNNKGITLCGDVGCGKSTIALSIADQLLEGWTIFYIEGIDPHLSPYLTWHIGTNLYSKKKLNLDSNISFGISFPPVPVSIELGVSMGVTNTNYILTPSEEAIIFNIKKQADANRKVLFIADNFEMWDVPSKQLLRKIIHPQLELFKDYHVNVLLVAQSNLSLNVPILWNYIEVPNIPDESMLYILREHGHAEPICIKDIRMCAGNDLSLALMAADYYTRNGVNGDTFFEIMDRRCDSLPPEKQEIRQLLGSLSIIDTLFSKDEAAYFMDPTAKSNYEVEYIAEEYLFLALEQMFIKGENNYLFVNEKVKDYFKAKLANKGRYYHRKFSNFLRERHPEDYYSRGKHLALSLQSSDTKINVEAWQLLLLAYFRRSAETGDIIDVYNLFSEIRSLINQLPISAIDVQSHVFSEFTRGYQDFAQYNYKNALQHFQAITPSRLVPACQAECQRLMLLCHIQLSEDRQMIIQTADELYNIVESIRDLEAEQYCRAALVLLDAYIDRSNDHHKVNVLKNNLIRIIQEHMGTPEFDEFEACYNRKAALYYAAIVAYQQTEQSIQFYKKHYNRNGIYMSLCNHSGNSIVSGKYSAAEKAVEECLSMLEQRGGWYYPSQYKIENNKILLDYLREERLANSNREETLLAARKAVSSFSSIIKHQHDEVSHVILFNYIGLSILCQTSTWEEDLASANMLLPDLDEFYQYYLYDLNYAKALLMGNVDDAKEYLEILKSIDAPLLYHYRKILQRRRLVQEEFISNHTLIKGDPFEYHRLIHLACNHIQDDSCYFWGRGFLLSDLQFLSF